LRKIKETRANSPRRVLRERPASSAARYCGIAAGAREIMQNVLVELEKRGSKVFP
jgi:hypothetical protein